MTASNRRPVLFCIPHVGAGGAAFNSWSEWIPADVELCAVRFPGRENRLDEPLIDDPDLLLNELPAALMPLLDRPFVLFGHCSGSVIAFEFVRRLRTLGAPQPSLLVVSSTEAPRLRRNENPFHQLPRTELLDRVVEFGGMAKEVLDDPDLMEMFERILRADYRVVEQVVYSAGPPLAVPTVAISGRNDPFVSCEAMVGWYAETTGRFSPDVIDAGHLLLAEAGRLVGELVRDLAEAR